MKTRIAALATALAAPTTAAPAKKSAKPAASKPAAAKPAVKAPPPVVPEPVAAAPSRVPVGGFMVPKQVILKNPTAADIEANAVWNLRAAMNVAALQCQYSAFLRTTRNYNSFLQAHSEELIRAQMTMIAHFRRTDGAKALSKFDEYTTRNYNRYSTLDAQYAFCNAAGLVGRHALAVSKGKLGTTAIARGPEIRAALAYSALSPSLAFVDPDPVALPDFAAL